MMLTEKRVGVIGWPVTHSLSPAMHNAAFRELGLTDWMYDLVPIPPDIVRQGLRELREEGGYVGVNVTVPLKQAVMPYVRPDEIAQAVGAVNTITFRDLSGTNTDVAGFIGDLQAHDVSLKGAKVVLLGAGGAARAAIYGLAQEGAHIAISNRTTEKAQQIINELDIEAQTLTLEQAAEWGAELIVNCTSVGMWPNVDGCLWPDEMPFPHGVTLYDMVYRPQVTRLMELAEANGGRAIGGAGMLVRQGAAAFTRWTGHDAPIEVMAAALQDALAAREH